MSTIAAISTPNAAGGIGIIRISGENAIEIASRCFCPVSGKKVTQMQGYTAAYGTVTEGENALDDGVLLIYRAPKSYTGEDVAELCCHGGLYILQRALRAVFALGAVPASPGEFTRRAFLNGKMDLSQAESVMNIISAQGNDALTAARNTLKGNISRQIDGVCSSLISAAAGLAAWADYPEEDIEAVQNDTLKATLTQNAAVLSRLINDFDRGKSVTQGVNTVICGKPNVGKSTLMNLLTGFDRSIVTSVAGTTRDVIEETVRVGDVLLRLADTAGIHQTEDIVEQIGVNRAKERLNEADLILAVFDASVPFTKEDEDLINSIKNKRTVAVINKTDLPPVWNTATVTSRLPHSVLVCAKNADTFQTLEQELKALLGLNGLDFTAGILASERQRDCVRVALENLNEGIAALETGLTVDAVNVNLDCAVDALLALTGKKASEEIVNEVFRKFCVGK